MQRIKSIRHSISSRSSRRRSGLSTTSSTGSPRPSQDDVSASNASPATSTADLTSSPSPAAGVGAAATKPSAGDAAVEEKQEPVAKDAPIATLEDTSKDVEQLAESDLNLQASSISEPPVIVEPPTPEPPPPAEDSNATATATAAATATGHEAAAVADSSLRNRKDGLPADEHVAAAAAQDSETESEVKKMPAQQQSWVMLAVASGGFAALNGVFAKLTTASLTTTISRTISTRLQLPEATVNPTVRSVFFALNLLSNAVMWALFTRALTAHPSATKVSLINTSANFLVTAVLGVLIFAEVLPASWFGGAALLVLGTLIIGRDRAGGDPKAQPPSTAASAQANGTALNGDKRGVADAAADAVREPLLAGDE